MHFLILCRKGVPNSPRIITTGPPPALGPANGTSPKGPLNPPTAPLRSRDVPQSVATSRPLLQYHPGDTTYATALPAVPAPGQLQLTNQAAGAPVNPTSSSTLALQAATNSVPVHESLRRYFVNSTTKFFGLNGEESNEKVWIDRRRRVAIKLFGGVKDDFHMDGTSTFDDSLVIAFSSFGVRSSASHLMHHLFFFYSSMKAMEYDYAMTRWPVKWLTARWCWKSTNHHGTKTLWAVWRVKVWLGFLTL